MKLIGLFLLFLNFQCWPQNFFGKIATEFALDHNKEKAESLLAQALIDSPNDPITLYNLGQLAYEREDYIKAWSYFEGAIKNSESNKQIQIQSWFQHANTGVAQKKWQAALDSFKKVVELQADHKPALEMIEKLEKLLQQQKKSQNKSPQSNKNSSEPSPDQAKDNNEQQNQEGNTNTSNKDQSNDQENDTESQDQSKNNSSKHSSESDAKESSQSQENNQTQNQNESNSDSDKSEDPSKNSKPTDNNSPSDSHGQSKNHGSPGNDRDHNKPIAQPESSNDSLKEENKDLNQNVSSSSNEKTSEPSKSMQATSNKQPEGINDNKNKADAIQQAVVLNDNQQNLLEMLEKADAKTSQGILRRQLKTTHGEQRGYKNW